MSAILKQGKTAEGHDLYLSEKKGKFYVSVPETEFEKEYAKLSPHAENLFNKLNVGTLSNEVVKSSFDPKNRIVDFIKTPKGFAVAKDATNYFKDFELEEQAEVAYNHQISCSQN